jgi:murein DD-endopeptidase MepM/ murein hydrolase activator NlpD
VGISPPLKGSNYVIIHGGDTYPVNYHGIFAEAQKYALDIVKLNEWGFRASGIYPNKTGDYRIFADTVYSPIDGIIRSARSTMPDQNPPKTNGKKPFGNYLWIEHDSLHVVLAHLKKGSLLLSPGDSLQAGEPVAQVGNSGNTSEPHLHLQAMTFSSDRPWNKDSTFYRGKPVPLCIESKFLSRNQKLP